MDAAQVQNVESLDENKELWEIFSKKLIKQATLHLSFTGQEKTEIDGLREKNRYVSSALEISSFLTVIL